MPTYSVIIPVYNAEKYLNECLDSILTQDFTDYEIILIDDGSTDESGSICDSFSQKYCFIKTIHQENCGVSLSRQLGIENSNGEYLLFVDADDKVANDYFKSISDCPKTDVIRFGSLVELSNKKVISNYPIEKEGLYDKQDIIKNIFPYLIQDENANYYCPSLWAHCFKKSLFVSNMVKNVQIKIGEDGACVIPTIYNATSLYVLNKCLYMYRFNELSATKSRKIYDFEYPMKIYNHIVTKINVDEYDFVSQLYRKIVHELFHVIISYFNKTEKYKYITKELNGILDIELYSIAIDKAKFSSLKSRLLKQSMKKRHYLLFKIYNILINK